MAKHFTKVIMAKKDKIFSPANTTTVNPGLKHYYRWNKLFLEDGSPDGMANTGFLKAFMDKKVRGSNAYLVEKCDLAFQDGHREIGIGKDTHVIESDIVTMLSTAHKHARPPERTTASTTATTATEPLSTPSPLVPQQLVGSRLKSLQNCGEKTMKKLMLQLEPVMEEAAKKTLHPRLWDQFPNAAQQFGLFMKQRVYLSSKQLME